MKTKFITVLAAIAFIGQVHAMENGSHDVTFINDTSWKVRIGEVEIKKGQQVDLSLAATKSFSVRIYDKLEIVSRIGAACFPFCSGEQHDTVKNIVHLSLLTNAHKESVVKPESSSISFFIMKR